MKKILGEDKVAQLRSAFYRRTGKNKIHVSKDCILHIGNSILRNCIVEVSGKNCRINLGTGNRYLNCKIQVYGDNCEINIGDNNFFNEAWLWLEDTGSHIKIGNDNRFTGNIQLAAIEGTGIEIGEDNLFSRGIQISTGDSHSIISLVDNKRINPSADIIIRKHNWIGMDVTISKGVSIGECVVVGRNSVVTRPVEDNNVAVAGVPAKVVKREISWEIERI